MDWATVAQLIITVGIPATQTIVEKWANREAVTPEEFAKVRGLANQTAQDRMKLALVNAGIDLESEPAKKLLEQTK